MKTEWNIDTKTHILSLELLDVYLSDFLYMNLMYLISDVSYMVFYISYICDLLYMYYLYIIVSY